MSQTLEQSYKAYLDQGTVKKLPYLESLPDLNTSISALTVIPPTSNPTIDSLRKINIIKHNKTKENLVQIYQKGCNIKEFGRIKGNMQYVEDSWDVQIQPLSFKYVYLKNNQLTYTPTNEMKIRDKYIKIRVRYDGTQYAIINAIRTFFTISYS